MTRHHALPLAIAVLIGLGLASPAAVAADEAMTPAEVEATERVIRDYLMAHPEVIVEAMEALQAREQQAALAAQRQVIVDRQAELLQDPAAPVAGNPDGTITIVEFFDYQCPYCKTVAADLMATLEAEDDVRLVFKEFPILGPASDFAAKAALAAHRQDKYLDFHLALMKAKGKLSDAAVLDIAGKTGLDLDRLREDMDSPEVADAIARNHALAEALRIRGTPAFVIGEDIVPGADMEQMRQLLEAERNS